MNLLLVVICLGTLMVELPQADDGPPELVPDDDDGPQALLHLPPPDVGPEGCLLLPDSDDGMEILRYPCRFPCPCNVAQQIAGILDGIAIVTCSLNIKQNCEV